MPTGPERSTQLQKVVIQIDEVDLANRVVHGRDKTNVLVVATFRATPAGILVVPAQYQRWVAARIGMGQWYLESRLDSADDQTWAEANLQSGDMRIDAANVHFTGTPQAPTPATSDNSPKLVNSQWVKSQGYITAASAPVSSVFGRTGAIVAVTGDYTAAQVTNAADKSSVSPQIFTGGAPRHQSSGVFDEAFGSYVTGDTFLRFRLDNNGEMAWGTGAAGSDVVLARNGVGQILVQGTTNAAGVFIVDAGAAAVSQIAELSLRARDAASALVTTIIYADAGGNLVYRRGASTGAFYFQDETGQSFATIHPTNGYRMGAAASNWAFQNRLLWADAQVAFAIFGNGKMQWGPGGSTVPDTTLYRQGVGLLQTDGILNAVGGLQVNGVNVLTNAPVTQVFGRTGAIVATTGDYTAAQVTNAADKSSASQQAFTGEVKAPDFTPAGLTGATAASRYVGGTTTGAPTTGTFVKGDFAIAQDGGIWVCTTAGSPGTWTETGSVGNKVTSFNTRTGAVVPATGDYTAAMVTNAADKSSASQQVFTGEVKAPDFVVAGLTGATAASRYVGATASGAPTSGTFAVGDWVVDQTAGIWVCTAAGTPGTWVRTTPKMTTSAFSGGPPTSPVDGDIWIATGVDTNGTRWQFQYNAGSGSAYKWEFIGGAMLTKPTSGGSFPVSGVWALSSTGTWTIARGGDYTFSGYLWATTSASGGGTLYGLGDWYNGAIGSQLSGIAQGGSSLEFEVNINDYPITLNAGDTLGLAFYSNSAFSAPVSGGAMSLLPRRVS